MITSLTFITGNAKKAEAVARHLPFPIAHQKIDLTEIQSLDLLEIVEHKVKEAYKIIKKPVLIEDVSLTFHALGKLPGPLIKWFLTQLDNEGLCRLLNTYNDRSATATVCYALYDGKMLKTFIADMKGSVPHTPRGENGFGWDQAFVPKGYKKTWAEMTQAEQDSVSMRKLALQKLEKYLTNREERRMKNA